MSEENVEFIRRAFADLGHYPARVKEGALDRWAAPDIEIDVSDVYPDAPVFRGVAAWREFMGSLPWGDSLKLEPERYFDVDDERVLVFMRVTAEGEGSKVPVEMRNAHEFKIRDGVCTSWKVYADRDDALEAAGLAG
jgi:ketosteroid isomerase-like protein